MSHSTIRAGAGARALLSALFLLAWGSLSPQLRAEDQPPGPVSDALVVAMRALPEHARPLFVVGDVNEDGAVDGRDRVLVEALVKTDRGQWPRVGEASCPAAADLNLDGEVDAGDVALAADLLGEGRIATPALFHQEALPCRFERPLLASQTYVGRDEDLPLWILARGYAREDVEIQIEQGRAVVRRGEDGHSFQVRVAADQALDQTLVLRIVLRGGPSYFFSLPVSAGAAGAP